MFSDIIRVSDSILMVEGKIPRSILLEADVANAVLAKKGDTLYIFDTGCTKRFRKKMIAAAEMLRPFNNLVLINTHCHPDHTANNGIIGEIAAVEKSHYLHSDGLAGLDYKKYFSDGYRKTNFYYHFLDAPRPPYSYMMLLYKLLGKINPELPYGILDTLLKKFRPLTPSKSTVTAIDPSPAAKLPIKSAEWKGWTIDGKIHVIESGAHSPDSVMCYLPEDKLLIAGDELFFIYPLWADSSCRLNTDILRKLLIMAEKGDIETLISGHHHEILTGERIITVIKEVIAMHSALENEIVGLVKQHPEGLTVHDIYSKLSSMRDRPGVDYHLSLDFPKMPIFLKSLFVAVLLEAGCRAEGPDGNKKFLF